jgi:hypothetical protein
VIDDLLAIDGSRDCAIEQGEPGLISNQQSPINNESMIKDR